MAEEKNVKKEEKKETWWEGIPMGFKALAIGILAFIFWRGNIVTDQNTFLWLGIAAFVFWLLYKGQFKEEMITPEVAEELTKKELERKQKENQFPANTKIYIGPNNGLKHHRAMPQHYIIALKIDYPDHLTEYKRAVVDAKTGFVTIQDSVGKTTGREAIPTKDIVPAFLKQAKEYGLTKYLFGK